MWFHKDCAGITASEYNVLKSKNCSLLWFCTDCANTFQGRKNHTDIQIKDLTQKMDNITDFIANGMKTLIKENMEEILSNMKLDRPSVTRKPERTYQQSTGRATGSQTPSHPESGHIGPTQEDQGIEEGHVEDSPWMQANRRKPRQQRVIGTRKEVDSELEAAVRMAWLYVGKLKHSTTADLVTNFLKKNGVDGNVECEKLTTQGRNSAFKVGFPLDHLDRVNNAEFWPDGTVIRRFRFRNNREHSEGRSLE